MGEIMISEQEWNKLKANETYGMISKVMKEWMEKRINPKGSEE